MPHRRAHLKLVGKAHRGVLRGIERLNINDNTFLIIMAAFIGVFSALCYAFFRVSINAMEKLFFEDIFNHLGISYDFPGRLLLFFIPIIGALLIMPLIVRYPKEASGYGLPGLLENVIFKNAVIPPKVILLRTLTTSVTLGCGGSAGREGPIVTIGAALGSAFGQFLKLSGDRMRILVACGAAGGIAAAFDAPIAGAMFALEIMLLGNLAVYSFSPIVISAGVATVTTRAIFEKDIEFTVPAFTMVSLNEFYLYCILGIITGLVAVIFIRLYYHITDRFDRAQIPVWQKVLLGASLLGAIGVLFPQVFGVGYKWMNEALMGNMALYLMLALVFLKMIATAVTLGCGLSGGVFGPSLFIGLMLGGSFAAIVNMILPGTVHEASYAMVGMGAMVAAASQAPLTAIFLLFEMTGDFNIVLPTMFACMISVSMMKILKQESIDMVPLTRKGYKFSGGKDVTVMQRLKVRDVETKNCDAIPESMSFRQIQMLIARSSQMDFPVLDQDGKLVGIISFQDIRKVIFEEGLDDLIVARDIATTDLITVKVDDTLQEALEKFTIRDYDHLPVVESDGTLHGLISRQKILQAYNNEIQRIALQGG
ncbi:chloride channel protein [Desulfurispira natronophila]|uniref:CIC family chloride channel protein n=1 Tax=Desulfurispira natronophila TaxID=682562 RepID=A0A7W8DGN5_9BACT|nr:chloride channel protein [Desulfurispira natronophila]MBB5021600.1 CIC family chloride channel protein [Desulfurispira natronophila]